MIIDGGLIEVVTPDLGGTVEVWDAPNVTLGGGATSGAGVVLEQAAPAALWSWPNPLRRLCGVAVYVGAELVEADVSVTAALITVTFPTPTSGAIVAA